MPALHPGPTDPEPTLLETALGPVGLAREGDPGLPAVIAVHGIPGSTRDFRYLAPLLLDRYQVLRLDMPGFGIAPISTVRSRQGWAELIHAVADTLGLERPLLMSHSFGGTTLLRANALAPDRFGALVLLASPGARRHRAYNIPAVGVRGFAWLAGQPLVSGPLCAASRRLYRRIGLRLPDDDRKVENLMHVVGSLDFDEVGRDAQRADLPVLLAHAADDPLVELAVAEELERLIPQATLLTFERGGHYVQKAHASEIAAAVLALHPR